MAAISITAANVRAGAGATSSIKVAGETITAGQLLYLKESDGKYWLSDNSTAESSVVVAIALGNAAADGNLSVMAIAPGVYFDHSSAIWTKGKIYELGDTNGGMTLAGDAGAGDFMTIVGHAVSTTSLFLVGVTTGVSI